MKTLKSITKSEIQLLMDFDYNNVFGRIKYVLGKDASLFSDIFIKNSVIHWMVRDDSEYVPFTELSPDVQSEVKGTLSERISYVSRIISEDSLIGVHFGKILSYPSDEYIFVKDGKGNGDIVITGWGCKSLLQDSQHILDASEMPLIDEPAKDESADTCPIEPSSPSKDCLEETADIEQKCVSAKEQTAESEEIVLNDSAISDDALKTDESGEPEYTSEWLKNNTEIHGWLSFFFFAILLGGLISAIYPIATYEASDYGYNGWLGAVDVITGFSLLGIAIYTVYAFTKRRPNAVFYGRFYVIVVLITNIISLMGDTGEDVIQGIRGIIWGSIWFFYLLISNQVKEVIPKSFRKVSGIDWGVLAILIIVPLACFFIGVYQLRGMVE